MHLQSTLPWRKPRSFVVIEESNERRTLWAGILTAITMIVEIIAGALTGSMALLADGWHMGTHLAALGVAMFAYRYARRRQNDPSFAFGTGKVSVLGGFASAVALAVIGLMMILESAVRFISPQTIHYAQALAVACAGLIVNLACAAILGGHAHSHGNGSNHEHEHEHEQEHQHQHDHEHDDADDHEHEKSSGAGIPACLDYEHEHEHEHEHEKKPKHLAQDHNIQAAYLHVLADAMTSVLAIGALLAAWGLGWVWMDAAIGIVGGAVVGKWAWNLIRDTSAILLDRAPNPEIQLKIRARIEAEADNRVADLRVWPVGPGVFAAIVSLVSSQPRPPSHYASMLKEFPEIVHLTIEAHPCVDMNVSPAEPGR